MSGANPDDSDAMLAARALKGDRSAFNHIVRRHQEPLYRFIRRYVGETDEAYDLLQETFVSAWQALGRYDPARPAATWLRRIALNKCRDWGRRRVVRRFFYGARALDETTAAPEASADDANEAALLTAFEGVSQAAAGEALGISAKAVETRVYRARKQLAEALKADGLDVDET